MAQIAPHQVDGSQSPDEDSLSSDPYTFIAAIAFCASMSQSPDEDSLIFVMARLRKSSSALQCLNPLTRIHCLPTQSIKESGARFACRSLNPLTRIHCLPTEVATAKEILAAVGLNPLTRIHCLPTPVLRPRIRARIFCMSQSPDEDSLSSDRRILCNPHQMQTQ